MAVAASSFVTFEFDKNNRVRKTYSGTAFAPENDAQVIMMLGQIRVEAEKLLKSIDARLFNKEGVN